MMTTETTFYISGLKCGGCIATAKESLSKVTGFESAEFDLKAGIMRITGDVDPQAVSRAMSDVGYAAVVKSA
ncbi:MAG: heavy-metal-associated domain-containing protein [Gammaproteobacteria bacterium]|nr:heavy-metal-associated domain-containing protein [Gammaproteobacteria bacterium]